MWYLETISMEKEKIYMPSAVLVETQNSNLILFLLVTKLTHKQTVANICSKPSAQDLYKLGPIHKKRGDRRQLELKMFDF